MTTELVTCRLCQTIIPEPVQVHQISPYLQYACRRDLCRECEFQEAFKFNYCAKKPYKHPFPRPTIDGKMPESLKQEVRKMEGQV